MSGSLRGGKLRDQLGESPDQQGAGLREDINSALELGRQSSPENCGGKSF